MAFVMIGVLCLAAGVFAIQLYSFTAIQALCNIQNLYDLLDVYSRPHSSLIIGILYLAAGKG